MKVDLDTSTIAVLVSGLYCVESNIDAMAVPQSVWIAIAEKLEYFLPNWNYESISFEEWVRKCLFIVPKILLTEDDIEDMKKSTLYWEFPNGNMMLVISMDVKPIDGE